jgi:hypothetical protein
VELADRAARVGYLLHQHKRYEPSYSLTISARPASNLQIFRLPPVGARRSLCPCFTAMVPCTCSCIARTTATPTPKPVEP